MTMGLSDMSSPGWILISTSYRCFCCEDIPKIIRFIQCAAGTYQSPTCVCVNQPEWPGEIMPIFPLSIPPKIHSAPNTHLSEQHSLDIHNAIHSQS